MLGEPIAYLINQKEFWSLKFYVDANVLIPRPDTELLIQEVLKKVQNSSLKILDLGTGSGAIAISLALECPYCRIYGVDNNLKILQIAKKNSIFLKANNVQFIYSDWFLNLYKKKFHIIVCNPPYLSILRFKNLRSHLLYEPYSSLVAGDSGLESIQIILNNAPNYLYNRGWFFLEHCFKQTLAVRHFFKKNNFSFVKSYIDESGRYRITQGRFYY